MKNFCMVSPDFASRRIGQVRDSALFLHKLLQTPSYVSVQPSGYQKMFLNLAPVGASPTAAPLHDPGILLLMSGVQQST